MFEAISHLEKMKMTHRDIKPDNIFMKKENGVHRLYLADFGCSIDKLIFKNEPGLVSLLHYRTLCIYFQRTAKRKHGLHATRNSEHKEG